MPSRLRWSDNQFVTRVDYTINPKNNLFGRYFIDGYQAPAFFSPTNILITTASGNLQRVQSLTVGEEYTINSNTVNSAHISATRRRNNRGYNPAVINLTTLGVNVYQAEPNGLQLTVASSGKNHGWATGGGTNSVAHFNNNAFIFDDDVTMVRGKHQFVFGGSYVRTNSISPTHLTATVCPPSTANTARADQPEEPWLVTQTWTSFREP